MRYRPAYISRGCTPIFKIELYSTEDGKEVLAEFINELPAKHQAKAFREIDLLAEFGNALKEPYVKHIDGEIWQADTIVLLHGFIKKTQKTPRSEIETAQKRLRDYKRRH